MKALVGTFNQQEALVVNLREGSFQVRSWLSSSPYIAPCDETCLCVYTKLLLLVAGDGSDKLIADDS